MTPPPRSDPSPPAGECEFCRDFGLDDEETWAHIEELYAALAAARKERDRLREFVRLFDAWFPLALKDAGRLDSADEDSWDRDYLALVKARRALAESEKEGGG